MQNVGTIILIGENRNNQRKGSPITTLSVSIFKWTGLFSNPNLRDKISATILLRLGLIPRRLREMLTCRSTANSRTQPLEWLDIKG
jgi:hypothetical protein